jgi:hypothetical protein
MERIKLNKTVRISRDCTAAACRGTIQSLPCTVRGLSLRRRPVCSERFNKNYRILTSISFHRLNKTVFDFQFVFKSDFF